MVLLNQGAVEALQVLHICKISYASRLREYFSSLQTLERTSGSISIRKQHDSIKKVHINIDDIMKQY